MPDYTLSVLMYGPDLLDERPQAGERFATAMLQGMRQYRLGKTPRNRDIVERASGLSAAQVEAACWPLMREDGRIDPSLFLGYQQWNVARGLVDRVLADDELFDHRFIEAANATLAR